MRINSLITTALLLFLSLGIAAADDILKDRFQIIDNSVLVDSETGLMWALQDNGKDIDWWEAKQFCEEFTAGGYDDWRLPEIKELATLYTEDEKNNEGFSIARQITVTDCCIWSSYDVLGGALAFNFKSGKRIPMSFSETYQLRALPVRGTSRIDLKKYKIY